MSNKIWMISWINILFFIIIWGLITQHYIPSIILFSLVTLGIYKKININFGLRFGRKAVISTFSLTVFIILFSLWDKKILAGEVMYFVISWIPVSFFPLILKDIFNKEENNNLAFPKLKKDTPFSPSPEPRPNLSQNRWFNKAFSYPLLVSTFNGIYPKAIYSLIIWGSCIFCLPENSPIWLKVALSLTILINLIDKRRNRDIYEWILYWFTSIVLAIGVMILIIFLQNLLNKFNYNWMAKEKLNGWFNNSYSETQIGKNGSFDDGQDLLLRVIWNDKKSNSLLPATYFDLYNEGNSSWSVAPDFVVGKAVIVNSGTLKLPPTNQMSLTDLSFITKNGNLKKYNYGNPTVSMKSSYNEASNQKDSYIVLLGQILKNTRSVSAIPLPTNASYIIGDQGDSRFTKYASGTVMFAHNNNLVNWQISYKVKKYLDLHSPINFDLTYPEKYNEIFEKIIQKSGINKEDNADLKVLKLQNYFLNNYKYTLNLTYEGKPRTLEDFLTIDKEGHCEYFATSMTLILRYLGIPSRYSTGFLVTEHHPEETEDMYWIRKKDSHAWSAYWNGEGWKFIDATPYSNSAWSRDWDQTIYDKFVHFQYVLDNISIDEVKDVITSKYVIVFIGLFIISLSFLVVRKNILRKKEVKIIYIKDKQDKKFEKIFKKQLKDTPRKQGEPWLMWGERVNDEFLINKIKKYYLERY